MSMSKFEFVGSRFVGGDWENGFGVMFSHSQENEQIATFTPKPHHQGPPTICHGGVLATLLDEAMTAAAAQVIDLPIFTVQMDISYRAAVFLGTEIKIIGRVLNIEGRKVQLEAQILLPDNTIAAEAKALFLRPREEG